MSDSLLEEEYKDNYDRVCEDWQKRFVTWDLEAICAKLGLGGCYPDRLEINLYGTPYLVDRSTGVIKEKEHPEKKLSFSTRMSVYHILYYSGEHPVLSGQWVPYRDVKRAAPFAPAFQKAVLASMAEAFDGKLDLLIEAQEKLGFRRLPMSDAGFEAMAYDCFPVRFLFWDGDEEFPAQFNILFDANAHLFLHEEAVVMIAEDGVKRIRDMAGLDANVSFT